jgi:hypothetical protein
MTHSPPIPAANQAPYPPIAPSSGPDNDKAALVARMKSNSEDQRISPSAFPFTLLTGAVIAGAIGYAFWSGRNRLTDKKQKKVPAAPRS